MTHQPTHRLRPVAAASLVVLLSAGLAACTDSDAEPEVTPETSVATSRAASGESSPVALLPSRESAAAFGLKVLKLYEAMLGGEEVDEFRRVSGVECAGCQKLITAASTLSSQLDSGLEVSRNKIKVINDNLTMAGGSSWADGATYVTDIRVPKVTFTAPGQPSSSTPAREMRLTFEFRWIDGGWVVGEVS